MEKLKDKLKRLYMQSKYKKKNVRFAAGAQVDIGSKIEGCNRIGANSFLSGVLGYGGLT